MALTRRGLFKMLGAALVAPLVAKVKAPPAPPPVKMSDLIKQMEDRIDAAEKQMAEQITRAIYCEAKPYDAKLRALVYSHNPWLDIIGECEDRRQV